VLRVSEFRIDRSRNLDPIEAEILGDHSWLSAEDALDEVVVPNGLSTLVRDIVDGTRLDEVRVLDW
jgi:hypothetical protein